MRFRTALMLWGAAFMVTGSCIPPEQQTRPALDGPRPERLPGGWLTYEREGGLIRSPFNGVSLRTEPKIYAHLSYGSRRIPYWEFGPGGEPTTLVLAAMHGGEYTPAEVGFRLVQWLESNPGAVRQGRVVVAPLVDPDGLESGIRGNDNGVDLNRNYPAKNWRQEQGRHGASPGSEPETQFVLSLMEKYRPACIISVHAALACVNYDGPGQDVAQVMSRICGLPVEESVGYPTPGSFGSYAGHDLNVPTITLELASKKALDPDFERCRDAIMAAHDHTVRVALGSSY